MTKQEEIMEGIAIWIYNYEMSATKSWWALWLDTPDDVKNHYRSCANELMKKLHSEGCVLKVEDKLPDGVMFEIHTDGEVIKYPASEEVKKVLAGYCAVEPLVEG